MPGALYIRHSIKAYKNGQNCTHSLDPNITDDGKRLARERFTHLLKQYGAPQQIVSSPYLRTRETALIAQSVVQEITGVLVPITYDSRLGEYLNPKHANYKEQITHDTMTLGVVPPCSLTSYTKGIESFLKDNTGDGWYITHGLTIRIIVEAECGVTINRPAECRGYAICGMLALQL